MSIYYQTVVNITGGGDLASCCCGCMGPHLQSLHEQNTHLQRAPKGLLSLTLGTISYVQCNSSGQMMPSHTLDLIYFNCFLSDWRALVTHHSGISRWLWRLVFKPLGCNWHSTVMFILLVMSDLFGLLNLDEWSNPTNISGQIFKEQSPF